MSFLGPQDPKKCRHYVRTWYREGSLEAPKEMWLCENCGLRAPFDDMAEEIEKVKKKRADQRQRSL